MTAFHRPLSEQPGLSIEAGVKLNVEGDPLVSPSRADSVRKGWAEASRKIAEHDDEQLAMGEFANANNAELVW